MVPGPSRPPSPGGRGPRSFVGRQQALTGPYAGQRAVIAGDGKRGRGGEVPGAQAPHGVTGAEQRSEETRGEGVARSDRLDDLDAQRRRVRGPAGMECGGAGGVSNQHCRPRCEIGRQ